MEFHCFTEFVEEYNDYRDTVAHYCVSDQYIAQAMYGSFPDKIVIWKHS